MSLAGMVAEGGMPGRDHGAGFRTELRISTASVSATLAVVGVVLVLFSAILLGPTQDFELAVLAMLCYASAAAVWSLALWRPLVGRWFAIAVLVALIYLGYAWLNVPVLLTLLVLPTILSAGLIGVRAAGVAAVAEAMLLLVEFGRSVTSAERAACVVAAVEIGAAFCIVWALYRPVNRVAQWSWEYYQRAQAWLEEAGDRQVELKQALKDLADANLQLTRLNMLAQGLRQQAEEARKAKEQFVAMVSHELRTPLNMITGFSEMIVQSPGVYGQSIPAKLLADLDVVLRNSRHLSRLIDDVLDLSQIEAEQFALTKERADLAEIIEAAVNAVRPLFESKGLYLQVEMANDLSPIFCDPTRIRQVLLNLLSNAGRFTRRGGVHLYAKREGAYAVVSVADTGSGLTPEAKANLFKPFHQGDSSIRRRYGGTGLGLSISKEFVELHGGWIGVESQEGVGTTFTFKLPMDPPPLPASDISRWFSPYLPYEGRTRRSRAPVPAIRPRFVVLEMGDSLTRLLTRYLDGAEIVPVSSLELAVQELTQAPVQALLINVPAGEEIARSLSGLASLPRGVPLINCTIPGIHDSAGSLAVADYLVKPVSRRDLLAAIDRLGLEGKTILLVDDEPDALRLFRRMLVSSGRGFRVLRASDGEEAMRVLHEIHPDLVLLDLVMPNMDGFHFLAVKVQDDDLRDIPVIVISACDPMGQPIVSDSLMVTQRDGLSVPQLLACVDALTEILATAKRAADPVPQETLAG